MNENHAIDYGISFIAHWKHEYAIIWDIRMKGNFKIIFLLLDLCIIFQKLWFVNASVQLTWQPLIIFYKFDWTKKKLLWSLGVVKRPLGFAGSIKWNVGPFVIRNFFKNNVHFFVGPKKVFGLTYKRKIIN